MLRAAAAFEAAIGFDPRPARARAAVERGDILPLVGCRSTSEWRARNVGMWSVASESDAAVMNGSTA